MSIYPKRAALPLSGKLSGRRSPSTVFNLPRSASPIFGRIPNAGLKSSRVVLTRVGTTEVAVDGYVKAASLINKVRSFLRPTSAEWERL